MIAAMSGPDTKLPTSLRVRARWRRLTVANVPAMLVHPDWETATSVPVVLWMHGRTVEKELDPGRYLRWVRAGIAACAVDLPGHGERFDADLQQPQRSLDVVRQMIDEIDPIVDALDAMGVFDLDRTAIGGVSAGGMAALARLCTDHRFRCVAVEATSGSWRHQAHRPMFQDREEESAGLDPIEHLADWRQVPLQALHARHDEWMPIDGQQAFIDALRRHYRASDLVEFIRYDRTGAPYEHAGFGRMASEAKNRQLDFLKRRLLPTHA